MEGFVKGEIVVLEFPFSNLISSLVPKLSAPQLRLDYALSVSFQNIILEYVWALSL